MAIVLAFRFGLIRDFGNRFPGNLESPLSGKPTAPTSDLHLVFVRLPATSGGFEKALSHAAIRQPRGGFDVSD
jgi:hypothetical protein